MNKFRLFLAAGIGACFVALSTNAAFASGTFTTLYSFTGGADGAGPNQPILDSAGNLYGTTQHGNINISTCVNYQTGACGTLFKLTPSGQLTTFVTFTGPNGAVPYGPLTLIGNTLYGSTTDGGADGYGLIFSINTDGSNFQILYQFHGKDGAYPNDTLLPAPGGALYGVTSSGGPQGAGELFQLNKGGTLAVLHAFKGRQSWQPDNLLYGPGGILYGSTFVGGKGCAARSGCGTVFSYDPKTKLFSLLYQFTDRKDGELPTISAIDAAGNIYGSTESGSTENQGATFELIANGNNAFTENTLFTFANVTIGNFNFGTSGPVPLPTGQLIEQSGYTLFLYDPKLPGSGSVLQTIPYADFEGQPILGANGTFYGSALGGGAYIDGEIYSYTRPNAP